MRLTGEDDCPVCRVAEADELDNVSRADLCAALQVLDEALYDKTELVRGLVKTLTSRGGVKDIAAEREARH